MALEKQLILAVAEDDGFVTPLFVSHPSATIYDFRCDWDKALEELKAEDPEEWSVNYVYLKLNEEYGYDIEYGEPENIRVSY